MRYLLTITLLTFTFSIKSFAAVKIVECEDKDGNKSFQKTCPPGYSQVNERKVNIGGSKDKIEYTSDFKVKKSATLYVIPDCDTCDEVREYLNDNEVSVTEIDVSTDRDIQTQLEEIAGSLRVPVTIIDEKIIHGYKRSEFKAVLEPTSSNKKDDSEDKESTEEN